MYHCIATDALQLMLTIQNILAPARCYATRSNCAGKIIITRAIMLTICQRASEASGIKKEAETPWGVVSLARLKECPEKIMSKFKGHLC